MGWVQRHRRHGAQLALGALVLQIVLAFGHVHLNPRGLTSETSARHRHVLAQQLPQRPAQNPGDDDDYCAICASIVLASSAFAPAPPQLLVPANFQRVEHCFNAARPLAESLRLAFRSRAPPVA
ncbi:MAG: hypothetical protein WAV38_31050 [Xanthobacteraceae bacterium]